LILASLEDSLNSGIIEISRYFSTVDIHLYFVFLSLQNSFEPVAKFYIPLKINFSTMPAYVAEVTLWPLSCVLV
jgi:hypothetical protein